MPKTVLVDTNIWVSACINRKGYPARIKELFLNKKFGVVISFPLLKELSDVLRRPRIKDTYGISGEEINHFVEVLAGTGNKVYLTSDVNLCRDHKGNMVLETAVKGNADYLVTRDDDIKIDLKLIKEMKKQGIKVVTVSKSLETFEI